MLERIHYVIDLALSNVQTLYRRTLHAVRTSSTVSIMDNGVALHTAQLGVFVCASVCGFAEATAVRKRTE